MVRHLEKFLLELGQGFAFVGRQALKGVHKAIGVSEYELTRALPKEFRSSLPSIEEIERELSALTRPARKKAVRKAGGEA